MKINYIKKYILHSSDPPVVSLEIVEPNNQLIEEHSDGSLPTMTLHCITLHGNPKQLQTVHWYRNGQHFLTTISFRKLQSSSSQPIPTSSTTTPSFLQHSFYHRIGTGKHFTLVDESTPLAGPLNGQFLLTPNGTSWLNMAEPYVHYLNEPEMLIIANVTREHRGNYSCLGFNGAANGSQLSNEKTISVKCMFFRKHFFCCQSIIIIFDHRSTGTSFIDVDQQQ